MKPRGICDWVRLGRVGRFGPNTNSVVVTLSDGRMITVYDDGTIGIQSAETPPYKLPEELYKGWAARPGEK